MDPFTLSLWVLRLAFVALIYVFFFVVVRLLWRDIRSAVRCVQQPARPPGGARVAAGPARRRARRCRSTP